MLTTYGVLRGKVDRFQREDDHDTPHLQIRVVDALQQAWRVPVNVLSKDQSFLVFHRADPLISHPILAGLNELVAGFSELAIPLRSPAASLDYLRAPLFDWPTGIAAPHVGPGENDDLQDTLITYLRQLQLQDGELFAFGAKFPAPGQAFQPRPIDQELQTRQGVHDIHMNQGNANPGSFAKDNGVFQDGGLILRFPNRDVGLFLRFQTQWLPTDNSTGHRLPTAQPIPPASAPGGPGPTEPTPGVSNPAVYIERALVNPGGDDPGKEIVVIGNTSIATINLTGWQIVDRNNKAEVLTNLVIPGGESRLVRLSGAGAQLGNKGGAISLRNPAGDLVHAVSYARDDARDQDRYLRFNT
jgi:uncharacterized protein YukJ